MRTFGVCASILAAAQLLIVSGPAFAQGGTPAPAPTTTPTDATPPKADAPKTDAPAAAAPATDAPKTDAPAAPATDAPKTDAAPAAPAAPATDAPATEAPKTEPAAPVAETSPAPREGMVLVHVDSPRPVSLEREAQGGTTWEFVCTAPCDEQVAVNQHYRLMGTELNPSKPFTFDGSKPKANITVRPGVHNKAEVGTWVLIGGGVGVVSGILVMALGSDTSADNTGALAQSNSNTIFIGSALLLAGLGASILGGAWLLDNRNTGVGGDVTRVTDEKKGPNEFKTEFKVGGYEQRQPTFATLKPVGLPSVSSVPFFSHSF